MPLAIPIDSPGVSVLSRINDFQSRVVENVPSKKKFIMNTKRHVLSSSVPSIPLIDQSKALFENELELDLKNRVSNITKKFNVPNESSMTAWQNKSKRERKEIFSSNRNISSEDFKDQIDGNLKSKKSNSELSGSWSKLKSFIKNSINEEKSSKEKDKQHQKSSGKYNWSMRLDESNLNLTLYIIINEDNLNNRNSNVSLENKSNKSLNSSSNINSIRSSSSSVTVSGSSICALTSSPPSPAFSSPSSSNKEKNVSLFYLSCIF